WLPVKPTVTEPFGAIVAVYEAGATLTEPPDWVGVPPHMLVMVCPSAKSKPSVQPSMAVVPVLRMVISPWKPPGHWPTTLYPTVQLPAGVVGASSVVTLTAADRAERLPAASRA